MTEGPIGVALSGGGFRAAFYGLGALRYLSEAGALSRIEVVAGVSGGSIAAAAATMRWPAVVAASSPHDAFMSEVYAPFVRSAVETNVRNRAIARWLGRRLTFRRGNRGEALIAVFDEELYDGLPVASLPERPQLIVTTTELARGRALRIAKPFTGSWDFGYAPTPPDLGLARAVAASAAVPILFPAVYLRADYLGLDRAPEVLSLVDGGVYDNIGLEWFQGWSPKRRPPEAIEPKFLVTVNASGPLVADDRRFAGPRAWNRTRKIQYAQTQATRVRWLVEDLTARRRAGVYLGITGDPRRYRDPWTNEPLPEKLWRDALPTALVEPLARLRTDLNRFSEVEAGLLAYHGYRSAHARLGSIAPDLSVAEPEWREFADMSPAQVQELLDQLERRRSRRGAGENLR